MDPPTWFTAIPATMTVDGRLPLAGYFLAGLWQPDAQSASAPGSAVIAHGTSIAGAARLTIFAMNPLYRADPEREWTMLGLGRVLGRPVVAALMSSRGGGGRRSPPPADCMIRSGLRDGCFKPSRRPSA